MKLIKPLLLITILTTFSFSEEKERLGQFYNSLKFEHIFLGDEASSYLYRIKYNSPSCGGLSYHVGYYVNGDTTLGSSLTLGTATNVDGGAYLGNSPSPKDLGLELGELYLRLKMGTFKAAFGQGLLDTPMTKNLYSMVPNFYGYYYAMTKEIPRVELEGYYITTMSYGSRAYNDYYLTGESTAYAGATSLAMTNRGEFINIGLASGTSELSLGIIALGFKTNVIPYTLVKLYEYYLYGYANNFYYEAVTKLPLFSDYRLVVGLQGLNQVGLASTDFDTDFEGKSASLLGAKVGFETYDKLTEIYAAVSLNGTNSIANTWGGDPIWTSTEYTRNEYRGGVSSLKLHVKSLDPSSFFLIGGTLGVYTNSTLKNVAILPLEVDAFTGIDFNNGNYLKLVYNFKMSEVGSAYDMNSARILVGLKY